MEDLREKIAKGVIIDKLRLKPEDKFIVMYDAGGLRIAAYMFTAASKINQDNSKDYNLDFPLGLAGGKVLSELPSRIKKAIQKADASLLITGVPKADGISGLVKLILDEVRTKPGLRHAHAIGIADEYFFNPENVVYLNC